jgi:hypothetical protein
MSQQPDTPSSYWQFDQSESEAAGLELPGQSGQAYAKALSGAAQDQQHNAAGGAWQVPNLAAAPSSAPSATALKARTAVRPVRRPSLFRILALLALVALLGIAGSASGFGASLLTHRGGHAPVPTATTGLAQTTRPPSATPSARPTPRPQPSPSPTSAVPTPTPVPQPVILAQDDFARPDQQLWGVASDGSRWGGDANASPVFSIASGIGRVQGGQGFFNAILGPEEANEEVFYSGSVSHFDQTRDNLGAVLRWTDNNHYYKAYFDGANLILIKKSAGVTTRLAAVPFAAQDGVSYSLRFRAVGQELFVRVWPSAGPEPGSWAITANDSALATGFGGLRVLLESGITVTVTRFQERSTV